MFNTSTLPNHSILAVDDNTSIQIEPWTPKKERFISHGIEDYTEIDRHEPDEVIRLSESAEIHIYDYGFAHRVYFIDTLMGRFVSGLYHGSYKFDKENQQMMSVLKYQG